MTENNDRTQDAEATDNELEILKVDVNEALALAEAAQAMLKALINMCDAAKSVVDCWEQGDLAGAVHVLEGEADIAQLIIAQAEAAGITTGEDE